MQKVNEDKEKADVEVDESKTGIEDGIQQKYMELQMLNQQMAQLQNQLNIVDQQVTELNELNHNLEQVEKISKGKETFFPIGPGVFLKGRIEDNKKVLINIGSGVVIKKGINEANELFDKRIEELSKVRAQIESALLQASMQGQYFEYELQKMSAES